MAAANTRQLYNFIQGSDINGVSSFDIWKSLNPNGTEAEFLEYIRSGPPGEKGEPGSSAYSYFLSCSDSVMKKDINNVLFPATIKFKGFYRAGSNPTRNPYLGRFIVQETRDGIIWEDKYTSKIDESIIEYTPSSPDVKSIKCRLYAAGGTTEDLDSQSVVILTDVENIEVGARNIFAKSDIRYEITNKSNEIIIPLSIVDTLDLQRLISKKLSLSYYLDTPGNYTNSDSGEEDTSNRFGVHAKLVWSDSTGINTTPLVQEPFGAIVVGTVKKRVSETYEVIAPEGYDTIDSFTFEVNLTLKPDATNENIWIFERPKLEIGSIATQWSLAPEDIQNLVMSLGNDAHVIATDKDGNNGDYTGCETFVKVYSGTNDVTNEASYEISVSEGVTGSWNDIDKLYTVTNLNTDNGYVDITATYRNVSVIKRFSLSKTRAGSKGESTYDIWKGLGYQGDANDFLEFLKGEPGEQGEAGKSVYDIWKELGYEGEPSDFIEFLKGEPGPQGPEGPAGKAGKSTYDIWKGLGYEGEASDFIEFLKGEQGEAGESTYDIWKGLGYDGDANDFIEFLKGEPGQQGPEGPAGEDGKSVYDIWKELGYEGNASDFLEFLKGEQGPAGEDGKSVYDIWKELGYEGNASDFLEFLRGSDGKSAYDLWKELGNEGTADDFIHFLRGRDGKSSYELWLELEGNEGKTEEEFLHSIAPQADWNQNDENSLDYVKNRTHWKEIGTSILCETECHGPQILPTDFDHDFNKVYIVTFNKNVYKCIPWESQTGDFCLGDSRISDPNDNTHVEDVPFLIIAYYNDSADMLSSYCEWYIAYNTDLYYPVVSIKLEVEDPNETKYHTLDENYIPDSIARKSEVNELKVTRYGKTPGATTDILFDNFNIYLPGITSLEHGTFIIVKFDHYCAENATLNINELGKKPIYYNGHRVKQNEIIKDDIILLVYDNLNEDGICVCVQDFKIATENRYGLTKLYSTTGTDTQGTMTQAAITEALNAKAGKSDMDTVNQKITNLENFDKQLSGTVEITDGNPTKSNTVLTVNPNGSEVRLYTVEEVDAMMTQMRQQIMSEVQNIIANLSIEFVDDGNGNVIASIV